MNPHNCADCGRHAGDAFVCRDCTSWVRRRLRLVADLARHADDKRARIGTSWRAGTTGRASGTPLPFDPRVTVVMDQVQRALLDARELAQRTAPSTVLSTDHPTALAVWLTSRLDVIRRHPDGPRTFSQVKAAAEAIEKLFDRPPDRVYVGRCGFDDCVEQLYADLASTATVVKCPKCEHETPIQERREVLSAGVENYLGTVKEISRLLRETLGDDVSPAVIWGLARQEAIKPAGVRIEPNSRGEQRETTTYRIGDVRAAVAAARAEKERRAEGRRVEKERRAEARRQEQQEEPPVDTEFRTKPNPDQPDRCPSIDPLDSLQCGRARHDDDQCSFGGIAWKKGTPRRVSWRERAVAAEAEVVTLTAKLEAARGRIEDLAGFEATAEPCTVCGPADIKQAGAGR